MKTALVTGGDGFIGSHLVKKLIEEKYSVTVADDLSRGRRENLSRGIQHEIVDLTRPALCESVFSMHQFDEVYHLAAFMGGVKLMYEYPVEGFTRNMKMSLNVLDCCLAWEVPKVLFTSSACLYPASRQSTPDSPPLKEVDAFPPGPDSGYGWAKLMTELLCKSYIEGYGMKIAIARLFNVYGPCFTPGTQVLTPEGIKFIEDLRKGDMVYTLNLSTGQTEIQEVEESYIRNYYSPIVAVNSRGIEWEITPDHNLLLKAQDTKYYSKTPAFMLNPEKSTQRMVYPIKKRKINMEVHRISLEEWKPRKYWIEENRIPLEYSVVQFLRFMAWYITEGNVSKGINQIVISQKDPENRKRIMNILEMMGIKPSAGKNAITFTSRLWRKYLEETGQIYSLNKHIPPEFFSYPAELLEIFYEELMLGDGDKTGRRYTTISKRLAEDMLHLTFILGKKAKISREGNVYRIHIRIRKTIPCIKQRVHVKIKKYQGPVYNVRTKNGIIYAGKNYKLNWIYQCEPYDDYSHVIPTLCRKAINFPRERFLVWGDGTQTRSFIYVDDAVDGIIRTMKYGLNKGPYNIGTPDRVTISYLAELIADLAMIRHRKDIEIEYDLSKPMGVIGRSADNQKSYKELGWQPSVNLGKGIAETMIWIEKDLEEKLKKAHVKSG